MRHRHFLVLIGSKVGCIHLLRLELLSVNLCGKVPVGRIGGTLVGMTMSNLFTVGRYHLRLTGLSFLGCLRFMFVLLFGLYLIIRPGLSFGFSFGLRLLFPCRFYIDSVLHCSVRSFLRTLFLFLLSHICTVFNGSVIIFSLVLSGLLQRTVQCITDCNPDS